MLVTYKIKHLQNICKNVLEPREVDGSKTFLQMFCFTCNHGLSQLNIKSPKSQLPSHSVG